MGTNWYKDSFIIFTGAGSGIGWELVNLLYPSTHNILAIDCNQESLEKLQADFRFILTLNTDLRKKEIN